MPEVKTLLLPEVMRLTHLGKRTIYDHIKAGTFPKPFKLGGKNAWFESAITAWIFEQAEKGQGDQS